MKILFVDHIYHRRTSSSNFFLALLRNFFDVEIFYVDPSAPHHLSRIAEADRFDVAVLWQIDFLAPYFLAKNIPTVVIPMYDGSGTMPDLHWIWARKARFINFSRRLHERIRYLGGESLLVRYYPEPAKREINPSNWNDDIRVFLWQRRPEHGINLQTIEQMFGDSLSAVHIHNAPDDQSIDPEQFAKPTRKDYKLSFSTWFASNEAYGDLLRQFNVFIAPRRSEGIGLGFLEAMALGMIVCAHQDATHDEYIANGINGILFHADARHEVDLRSIAKRREISAMALKSVADGHLAWLDSTLKVVDFIKQVSCPSIDVPEFATQQFLSGLAGSYYASVSAYRAFLGRNSQSGSKLSGLLLEEVLDDEFNYDPFKRRTARRSPLRSAPERMPWLYQNKLRHDQMVNGGYLIEGRVRLRDEAAWIVGEKVVFGFRIDARTGAANRLVISAHSSTNEERRYCVILNDTLLSVGKLPKSGLIEIPVPQRARKIDNELHLQVELPADSESLSDEAFGLRSIMFR